MGLLRILLKHAELIKLYIYAFVSFLILYLLFLLIMVAYKYILGFAAAYLFIKAFQYIYIRLRFPHPKSVNAIIVGAGISGLAAAYYLQKKKIPYLISEAATDLGGTWRDLKFHGSRVDTENVEYCFSFNIVLDGSTTNWSRINVLNYLRDTANQFNIFRKIQFNQSVTKVNFHSSTKKWTVSTADGSTYSADFLYNCSGYSNTRPYMPEFKGIDQFQGEIIHTVGLDESQTFFDQNVVLVGSGATMASCITSLVKVCKSLTIVQRSPSYIFEANLEPDFLWRLVRRLEKLGIPKIKNLYQIYRMLDAEIVFALLRHFPALAKKFFRQQWEGVVDPAFIDTHLTPRYRVLDQRIPVSSGLKELLKTKAISFETGEISHFIEHAIAMKSGKNVPCDTCILATGFDLNFFLFPIEIDGVAVDTRQINWYKGFMLGDVPNFFQAVGCFDCSWTQRIESAYHLAAQIIEYMSRRSLSLVKVPRRTDIQRIFVFKPNYILRKMEILPILYALKQNPTYDYFFSFHLPFCKELVFSDSTC